MDKFQSTRPVRGRDRYRNSRQPACHDFNPRAPCGGATVTTVFRARVAEFQSTRPVRGRDSEHCSA